MKRGILAVVILGIFLVLGVGFLILINNKEEILEGDNFEIMDCGKLENPACFSNRFSACLPVTAKLTATDGSRIDLNVLGYVNETCHLQREVNDVVNQNCYFPNGTNLTWDLVDQTFGNDKGLQSIVDSSCMAA